MDSQYNLLEVLDHINPAELDYQDWLNVGMALEYEGYGVGTWESWSRRIFFCLQSVFFPLKRLF